MQDRVEEEVVLGLVLVVPDGVDDVPDGVDDVPDGVDDVPDGVDDVPDGVDDVVVFVVDTPVVADPDVVDPDVVDGPGVGPDPADPLSGLPQVWLVPNGKVAIIDWKPGTLKKTPQTPPVKSGTGNGLAEASENKVEQTVSVEYPEPLCSQHVLSTPWGGTETTERLPFHIMLPVL